MNLIFVAVVVAVEVLVVSVGCDCLVGRWKWDQITIRDGAVMDSFCFPMSVG